jgi:transcription elongation factor S-II
MSARKITDSTLFRENIRKKLGIILNDDKKALNLEKGIFNYSLKEASLRKVVKKWDNAYFVHIYTDHLRSIYNNLKDNSYILNQISTGDLKPHTVAFMTHQEMRPDIWETMIQAKIKRDKHKFDTNVEAATDVFKCRRCKSNKTTYYQQQVRSADEPMTTFITCLDCGNRWKQN